MKWEYKYLYRTRGVTGPDDEEYCYAAEWTPGDISRQIAALGDVGWEPVAIVPRSSIRAELYSEHIGPNDVFAVLAKGPIVAGITTEEV